MGGGGAQSLFLRPRYPTAGVMRENRACVMPSETAMAPRLCHRPAGQVWGRSPLSSRTVHTTPPLV